MFGPFTKSKAWSFAIFFQLYPLLLCVLATWINPHSRWLGYLGIFLIAEFLLTVILVNWRQRSLSAVVDEMEQAVRLKVQSFILQTNQIAMGLTAAVFLFAYREMPTLMALCLVIFPTLAAEAYANIKFRRE